MKSAWNNELPAENIETNIEDLLDGDMGWTVPWALSHIGMSWYINRKYTADYYRGGTAQLLVICNKGKLYTILFEVDYKFSSEGSWPVSYCLPCNFIRCDKITEAHLQEFSPDIRAKVEALLR